MVKDCDDQWRDTNIGNSVFQIRLAPRTREANVAHDSSRAKSIVAEYISPFFFVGATGV